MNELTFKQISKELFFLALPMAFTQLIAVGSGFTSMAMMSTLGHDVLAASALIFSARISILIIGSSILFSLSILIGHAYGENQYQRIGNFVQQGWVLGLIISIPIMLIYWNIRSILLYFGQTKLLADIVQQFFHANIWGVLPFLLSISNQQLVYGTRKQKVDLIGNVFGVCVLLTSAYTFIFGKFGLPKLGVAGLGYALSIQGWFYFLFTLSIIYSMDFFKRFDIFTFRLHQSWQDLIRLFTMGWPICVQIGGEVLSLFVTAAMVGWLGLKSLAAYQVVTQYQFLVLVPLFALAQASGVMIGQAFGEKNFKKLNKIGYASIVFSLVISVVVTMIFVILPKHLASLYLDVSNPKNSNTVHMIVILFALIGLQQIFDGVRNVLTGSLRGLFDTRFPMIVGLAAIWLVGIPLAYLFAFTFSVGVSGILMGTAIGMFCGMLMVSYRWHVKNKRY